MRRLAKTEHCLLYLLNICCLGFIIGIVFGISPLQAGVATNTRTGENFRSLQKAINQAAPEDTLELNGTFKTNKKPFKIDKPLTLIGVDANVILDGKNKALVLKIPTRSDRVTIENITIQNGIGGIVTNAHLTLRNVSVINNKTEEGGGIYNTGTLEIIDSHISQNRAQESGGGIYNKGLGAENSGVLRIQNSKISHNQARFRGGGIATVFFFQVLIENSQINHNEATLVGFGGGIFIDNNRKDIGFDTAVILKNCRIKNNKAGWQGGGIWAFYRSKDIVLENIDFENNTPDNIQFHHG